METGTIWFPSELWEINEIMWRTDPAGSLLYRKYSIVVVFLSFFFFFNLPGLLDLALGQFTEIHLKSNCKEKKSIRWSICHCYLMQRGILRGTKWECKIKTSSTSHSSDWPSFASFSWWRTQRKSLSEFTDAPSSPSFETHLLQSGPLPSAVSQKFPFLH